MGTTRFVPDTRQVIEVAKITGVRTEELEDGDILYSWMIANQTDSRLPDITHQVKQSYLDSIEYLVNTVGPRRVMVDEDLTSIPPDSAYLRGRPCAYNVVFIRDDRWSLGAPLHLWERAELTWPNSWCGVMLRTVLGPWDTKPYGAYREIPGLWKLIVESRKLMNSGDVEIMVEKIAMEVAKH